MDKNVLLATLGDRFVERAASAVARRRLTERINPYTGEPYLYGYLTLDCRDGQHDACDACDCPHHEAVA